MQYIIYYAYIQFLHIENTDVFRWKGEYLFYEVSKYKYNDFLFIKMLFCIPTYFNKTHFE